MSTTCYIPNIVRICRETLPKLKWAYEEMETIGDIFNYIHLELTKNFNPDSDVVNILYRHHFPYYLKEKPSIQIDSKLRLVIARSIGFINFKEYSGSSEVPLNSNFEKAAHLLLTGSSEELKSLLTKHPELLFQNSLLGHRARLIDYLSSNGVELWRQIVPDNADKILEDILEFNLDRNVTNNIYGGSSLRSLIESSAHPKAARIENRLLNVLSLHNL